MFKHQANRMFFRGSEGIRGENPAVIFLVPCGAWWLWGCWPGSAKGSFMTKDQELYKAQNKNTMLTVRPDIGGTTRDPAQRQGQVALRSFVWGGQPTSDDVGQRLRGRVHLGWSVQPSSALEVWGLISSDVWDPAVSFWHHPFLYFPFLLKSSTEVPFHAWHPHKTSIFVPWLIFLLWKSFLKISGIKDNNKEWLFTLP